MKNMYCRASSGRKSAAEPRISTLIAKSIAMWGIVLSVVFLPGAVRADAGDSSAQAPTAAMSSTRSGKEIVARVNGVEITRADVEEKMALLSNSATRHASGGATDPDALRKEALDKLILAELAYEEAENRGITISAGELDRAIAEIKASVGGEEKYREGLKERRLTEAALRRKLQRNLMVKRIFETEVLGEVVISEEDMRKEFERVKNDFSMPEKVVIDDVVLFLPLEDEKSVAIAGNFLKKIQEDSEKNPWNIPSDGTFAVREREVTKDKQPELYDEARRLAEGEVSGVIKTSDSFHIIRLKQYTPAVHAQFDELRDRIERRLRALAQQKKLEEWENGLREGAVIEILTGGEEKR